MSNIFLPNGEVYFYLIKNIDYYTCQKCFNVFLHGFHSKVVFKYFFLFAHFCVTFWTRKKKSEKISAANLGSLIDFEEEMHQRQLCLNKCSLTSQLPKAESMKRRQLEKMETVRWKICLDTRDTPKSELMDGMILQFVAEHVIFNSKYAVKTLKLHFMTKQIFPIILFF